MLKASHVKRSPWLQETRVFCSRKHIEVKLFGISLVFIVSATFALQHGAGFVPREWQAPKGL